MPRGRNRVLLRCVVYGCSNPCQKKKRKKKQNWHPGIDVTADYLQSFFLRSIIPHRSEISRFLNGQNMERKIDIKKLFSSTFFSEHHAYSMKQIKMYPSNTLCSGVSSGDRRTVKVSKLNDRFHKTEDYCHVIVQTITAMCRTCWGERSGRF